jgi:serine/threonine protein kinase
MTIATGTRLGPYEILSSLGAGGMGEVYRARDTRLDRTVSVKILPQHLSSSHDRRQRFDREARAISSLSHPHICSLYDVGQQDGIDYLVMEYIDGESLAERLKKGPLALNQALSYAIQVADALDKAHRAGIVHRDLKPANIMLTRTGAKLLDFGLAKLRGNDHEGEPAQQSNMPTEPIGITGEGVIVGTFQYMAPEQLEAGQVDARTDIFAFGAVFYEMITGRKAFTGKSRVSLIGAILKDDPPAISTIQPMSPPALDHVVKTCLAKDPDERWQTAHDLMQELKWVADSGSQAGTGAATVGRGRNRERLAWIVATAILLLALLTTLPFVITHLREPPVDTRAFRLSIPAPNLTVYSSFAISPDGRRLAFTGTDSSGKPRLWVRPLDSLTPQPLPETDEAGYPFWSPDSRFIGFFAAGKLKKIDVSGGSPQTLCDARLGRGGTWNRDGVIVFAPTTRSALYRVSAAGGEAAPLTTLDPSSETSHRWPQFLPDGRHYLYLSRQEKSGIYVGSLDSKETRRIVDTDFNAAYAPRGDLLFVREGALMAQPFDAGKLELTGEPSRVAQQVRLSTDLNSHFTGSENGVLVYQSGDEMADSQLAWHDRAGKQISTVGPAGNYSSIWLSPDQNGVAIVREEKSIDNIWLIDIARNAPTRFTFVPAFDVNPIWSPDGSRIVFGSTRNGQEDLYVKPASGRGDEELLLKTSSPKFPTDWSSDGKLLLYMETNARGKYDIWKLPLEGDRTPKPFLQDDYNKFDANFSPDGKWIAYSSDESGQQQIYVQPFPGGGGKYQVSIAGGGNPRWRRDGKELFYISADRKLVAVEVKAGSTFAAGATKPLFDIHVKGFLPTVSNYAVSRDGQRFLTNDFAETSAPPITVVLNWTADLKRN